MDFVVEAELYFTIINNSQFAYLFRLELGNDVKYIDKFGKGFQFISA